jgi:hypothetical protein
VPARKTGMVTLTLFTFLVVDRDPPIGTRPPTAAKFQNRARTRGVVPAVVRKDEIKATTEGRLEELQPHPVPSNKLPTEIYEALAQEYEEGLIDPRASPTSRWSRSLTCRTHRQASYRPRRRYSTSCRSMGAVTCTADGNGTPLGKRVSENGLGTAELMSEQDQMMTIG